MQPSAFGPASAFMMAKRVLPVLMDTGVLGGCSKHKVGPFSADGRQRRMLDGYSNQ